MKCEDMPKYMILRNLRKNVKFIYRTDEEAGRLKELTKEGADSCKNKYRWDFHLNETNNASH